MLADARIWYRVLFSTDFKPPLIRSGEPLRHPKARTKSSFSAGCEAVPFQNKFKLIYYPDAPTAALHRL